MEITTLESGHDVIIVGNVMKATCQFCEKTKNIKFMGACWNGWAAPFSFPIWSCNACSKASGFENGNVNGNPFAWVEDREAA